jgi:hypothetical protein
MSKVAKPLPKEFKRNVKEGVYVSFPCGILAIQSKK